MIDTRSELEWFLIGIAIAGGRDKFKEEDKIFDETTNNVENNSETLSVKL